MRRQRTQKRKGIITVNKVQNIQQGLLGSRLALIENGKISFTYQVLVGCSSLLVVHLPTSTIRVTPASMLSLDWTRNFRDHHKGGNGIQWE